ncbi:MAG: HD domain-containing protein [Alphaproteobacteria bacterium]|nr:HD domain-containing protein [Alphaproteobacteria bacterium]
MQHEELMFLKQAFNSAKNKLNNDRLYISVIKRKFAHSWRVLQNGRKIIYSGEIPHLVTNKKLRIQAKQALLFHDIGRFEETVLAYKNSSLDTFGKKYDHGVLGADILSENPPFNDMKIVLAVRHHGHLIEEFYNDKDYKKLSAEEQKIAETYIKIVRDADKLDLYNLQKTEYSIEKDPFFCSLSEEQKYAPLSDEVKEQFFNMITINHKSIKSFADRILGCISWIFDINYKYSLKIIDENEYIDVLLNIMRKYCSNNDDIEKIEYFAKEWIKKER